MTEHRPHFEMQKILQLLPHRFPFLLIDRVESIHAPAGSTRVGWSIDAIKCVSMNEPYFPGHFPHRPVMPGVLQIEAMGQAAAVLCIDPSGPKMDVAIAGINEARFRKPVIPGDVLKIHSEISRDRGQILVFKSVVRVNGEIVSEAELLAKMFPLQPLS